MGGGEEWNSRGYKEMRKVNTDMISDACLTIQWNIYIDGLIWTNNVKIIYS